MSNPIWNNSDTSNTQYKLKTWMEYLAYLESNPLPDRQVSFIRDLAKTKLDPKKNKGVEFMTLKDLIEGDLKFYTQSFGGMEHMARISCRCAFNNSSKKYTDTVIEYLTVKTE